MKRQWLAVVLALGLGGVAYAAGTPAFEDTDTDHDGKVSRGEAAELKGMDFARADTNGDGQLSEAEFDSALGGIGTQHPGTSGAADGSLDTAATGSGRTGTGHMGGARMDSGESGAGN